MGRHAVFLDRDGVLTVPEFRDGRSFAPTRLEDFLLYDDAIDAVERVRGLGYATVVVTNQPDITTGKLSPETLEHMHTRLKAALPLDRIEVSTATRINPDRRRKPEPGMLFDAAEALDIDLERSFMVGDRASDVAAGRRAGCRTVFIDRGYTAEPQPDAPDAIVDSVSAAADWILTQN